MSNENKGPKAPPPETRLSGSGNLSSVLSPKRNKSKPNWAKWKYMPEVEAFQACALALNIDPDSMKPNPTFGHTLSPTFPPESFPSDEVAKQFRNLMEIRPPGLSWSSAAVCSDTACSRAGCTDGNTPLSIRPCGA